MGSVGGRFEVFVDPGEGASGSASLAPYRSAPKGPEPALVPPQREEDAGEPAPVPPQRDEDVGEPAPVPLPTGGDAGEPAPVPLPTGGDPGDSAAPRPAGDAVVGGAGSSSAAARSRPCLISAPNQAPAPVIGSSAPRRRAGPDGDGVAGRRPN